MSELESQADTLLTGNRTNNSYFDSTLESTFDSKPAAKKEHLRDGPVERVSIKTLRTRYKWYMIMMYASGFFSGLMLTTTMMNLYYIQTTLKLDAVAFTKFS